MPKRFNRREINLITDDLKLFLGAVKGPIDKLDYFTTKATELESNGAMEIDYRFEQVAVITEVENAVILQWETAEKKRVSIQLHLSPASLIIYTDRLFFQQVFFKLLSSLLEANESGSIVSVYVTDSDGKCIVEVIDQSGTAAVNIPEDYFKKYRITHVQPPASATEEPVLAVYKQLMDDMGGEMFYAFTKGKNHYFRLKFDMA